MLAFVLPYSLKYWQKLNLVAEPKITIARILADLNLAVRYRIAIRKYASRKFGRYNIDHQPPTLIPHQIIWLYGNYQGSAALRQYFVYSS